MMNQSALILSMASLLLLMYGTDALMTIINSKQDYMVGEEIILLCKAGGDGDITWQKNGEEIDDEERVFKIDETSSKLVIKKAAMTDTGTYTCQCEFDSGHSDKVEKELFIYDGPSFGQTTIYHEFLEGTDGVVPCAVTGAPEVVVQWFRHNQQVPSHGAGRLHQQSDNTLTIEKVGREDAGTYVCQAEIRGRPISKQLSVSVVINAPPTVHLKEEVKKVLAGPETNVSFVCLVDGLPKPNITWTMPVTFDPSQHHFNSDRSQLTIRSVARDDYGEYVCTATNKIAESSATIMLHVFETPGVFVSADQENVSAGASVSVSCNVSGHPQPELHWLNKHNGHTVDSTSGRVHAVNGVLVIEDVMPSDGGIYSCMAVSSSGNASRDVAIYTQPGEPHYLSVSPGEEASVLFSLRTLPTSGGTPITSFTLQWRQSAAEEWKEITVPASDPLVITTLKQYTEYVVRLAAVNAVGVGLFSATNTVTTKGMREPDSPILLLTEKKVESNTFSVPLKQSDNGGNPLQHFNVRYRQDKEGSEWKDMQLPSDSNSVSLMDLSYGSDYQLEVIAVNANGSSVPATFKFSVQPANSRMTKGSVAGIVMVIFLVVFLVVDATCCYRNRCGLLMSISVKLFGSKVPGMKGFEDVEGTTNGEVKLKGINTPRGSLQQTFTKEGGQLTEVTCDKASLTKHEKTQPDRELPIDP